MNGSSFMAGLGAGLLALAGSTSPALRSALVACENTSPSALQPYLLAKPPAKQTSRLKLRLNLPAYRLDVFRNDSLIRHYIVAIGDTAYPTPIGSFTVTRVDWDPWWIPPASEWAQHDTVTPPGPGNPMGRVRLAFREMYFIHGTPYPHSVGSPASHGCVRLSNANAIELAKTVIANNAPGVSPALVKALAATRGKTTHSIALEVSVPIEIRYDIAAVQDGKLTIYPDVYHRLAPGTLRDTVLATLRCALGDSVAIDTLLVRTAVERLGAKAVTIELPRAPIYKEGK